jgi:hypothetical protein
MSSRDDRNRRRKASDKLPPPNRLPQGIDGRGVCRITEFGVGSWCPTPDGSGPAEAVVFHFKVLTGDGSEMEMGLRLKSAERVDELIAMLERHRNDVWPGSA